MFGGDLIIPDLNRDFIFSNTAFARAAFPNFRDLAQAAMAVIRIVRVMDFATGREKNQDCKEEES